MILGKQSKVKNVAQERRKNRLKVNIMYPDRRQTACLHRFLQPSYSSDFFLIRCVATWISIVCMNPLVDSSCKVESVQCEHPGGIEWNTAEVVQQQQLQQNTNPVRSSPVGLIAASISNLTRLHRGFLSAVPRYHLTLTSYFPPIRLYPSPR